MSLRNIAFLTHTSLIPITHRTHTLTNSTTLTPRRPRRSRIRMSASPSPTSARVQKASVPVAFDWRNQWYPAAWVVDLPSSSPHAFKLWDKPLVLFRDSKTREFIVFDDVCPHRAAALSNGLLMETDQGTQITCSYHGWRFNTSGTCTDIPYAKTVPISACIKKRYPTTVWNGLLFVWFGDKPPNEALLPVPKIFSTEHDIVTSRGFRRSLAVSFIADVENLVDPAHVDWVHHGTGQGDRSRIPRDGGVESGWNDTGNLEGYVLNGNGKAGYKYWLWFQPPCSVFFQFITGLMYCIWHRPMTRDECDFFSLRVNIKPSRMVRLLTWATPRWLNHAIANFILDGDVLIVQRQMVELQRRNRDGYGGDWKKMFMFANGRWDTMVRQFREFIEVNVVGMPWVSSLDGVQRRLPMEDVNNRLLYHAKDCISCGRMLRWATVAMWASCVIMNLGAVLVISASLVGRNLRGRGVAAVGVAGLGMCLVGAVVGVVMVRMRQCMIYTSKAYDVSH